MRFKSDADALTLYDPLTLRLPHGRYWAPLLTQLAPRSLRHSLRVVRKLTNFPFGKINSLRSVLRTLERCNPTRKKKLEC